MNRLMKLVTDLDAALVTGTRADGTKFKRLVDNHPQWMQDVIHAAHGDRMPNDQVYRMIDRIVSDLAEQDEDSDIDTLREALYEVEPDVYTNDLTGWLHDRADNIYYLTEALEESEFKDGFQLLTYAQSKFIIEIGEALLEALNNEAESQGELEDQEIS